ncbi:hypothetical protein IAQ61_004165 [Plenodomus lingam]|uniref:uncharacterized protein n=1 Tax=Leptosphaeria maculans TaxID=5022 RepID=UPI00332CE579|nr:hypothetical protein IAQ61_004165 [Plenodomus lingam]
MSLLHSTAETCHTTGDGPVTWIPAIVAGIILLQIGLVFALLWMGHNRSKTYWRLLRESGEVSVNGPVLVWTRDLPPRPTISTLNLHGNMHLSKYRL